MVLFFEASLPFQWKPILERRDIFWRVVWLWFAFGYFGANWSDVFEKAHELHEEGEKLYDQQA